MRIKSQKDFFAGLMFMVVGGAFALGAITYNVGDSARMGPGFFPLMIGVLLTLVGAGVTFQSLVLETEDGDKIGAWSWRPLFFVIAANVIFGICIGGIRPLGIPSLGLIVGIYALVFVASLGGDEFKVKEVAILATVLALLSYGAFIMLLSLQFPVWPAFFTQ